jgi:organic radical activating enzyme
MKKHKTIIRNMHIESTLGAYNTQLVSGDFFPVYYGIEVTRHCNFKCIMCPNLQYSNNEKGHMDVNLFKEIIHKIAPFAEIIKLHWVGEPLLHPQIIDLIKYARNNTHAKLFLSTNGSMLSGEMAEQIRKSELDKLIISLNGAATNAYEYIRLKGRYSEVEKNINQFIQSVAKNGGPLCHIKMIQFKENESEIEFFKKKWSGYNNVMVDVTWASDWAGNVPGIRELTNYHNPISQKVRQPCSDLWFKMQIDWYGKVALCCFDAKGSVEIGDITKDSVSQAWQSNVMQAIRQKHISGNISGICSNCLDWATPSEYEFWYTTKELIDNPQRIWFE